MWMGTMIWHFWQRFGSKLVDNAATNESNDVILLWHQSSLMCSWDARQCTFTPDFDGFGEFDPLNVAGHHADSKRLFLVWLRMFWAIVLQNLPMGHFSRQVQGKINQNKKIRPYISRVCRDVPLRSIGTNFGLRVCLADVINYSKFYHNRLRAWIVWGVGFWPFP